MKAGDESGADAASDTTGTTGTTTVRPAAPSDAAAMARVHVESWRATYRGVVRDAVLDDPTFLPRREGFWNTALTDARFVANRIAVAEHDGEVVGIAMSGPVDAEVHLFVLYLLDGHHGSGAGNALLDAVVDLADRVTLWVADPNPRAQAFYRKRGFARDGTEQVDDGVREVRMVRPPAN
ncbi:GNAT family N-acetyltransferase [Curtobacterium sp. PhB115]|uniref:GNAT family N-acetyltransferase n=1 Tax=Curtobacterium sp. PhB115 TaxID=2485173 RepID=UPI000F9BE249|nr:GNAT family N-acetyltransferase [Curtobacterium sp. PhB115]ROP61372.1 ribosomal protein S18 acetylase RimI-like enzyme [Curtobacterium sp. PhB115]